MIFQSLQAILGRVYDIYALPADSIYNFFNFNSREILNFMHVIFKGSFDALLYVAIFLTALHLVIAISVIFKRKYREKPIKHTDYPVVTIQIPTYNELAAINCAKRCLEFDYPNKRYEILIGDDSSDKAISEKLKAFASKHKGMVKVTQRGSNIGFKPGNLNHMLKHTKGEFIVIFDSDFLPKKDFLKRIIEPFIQNPEVDAVQSRWIIKNFSQNLSSIIGGVIPMSSHRLGLPFLNMINGNGFIAGSAEAVRKKTLEQLGGWRSGALTEDIEYSLRLTRAGKKIVYLENLECECESPFTIKDLCRQQMRWAYGVISSLKSHLLPILMNKKLSLSWKINPLLLLSGYMVTFMFFMLAVIGGFSIITAEPQAVDWTLFFSKTGRNILLTSGYLFTSVIILKMSRKFRYVHRMLLASFSVGLLVIYTVTLGIFKALFNREMQWFMLSKKGNTKVM